MAPCACRTWIGNAPGKRVIHGIGTPPTNDLELDSDAIFDLG